MQEIVNAYKDDSQPKKVQSTGLHIAGQKYIVIKADETSLYGKKVGDIPCSRVERARRRWELAGPGRGDEHWLTRLWAKQGREGVVIVKTKQALLITHYPETVQPGTAANTVEKLGAYLVGVGY